MQRSHQKSGILVQEADKITALLRELEKTDEYSASGKKKDGLGEVEECERCSVGIEGNQLQGYTRDLGGTDLRELENDKDAETKQQPSIHKSTPQEVINFVA